MWTQGPTSSIIPDGTLVKICPGLSPTRAANLEKLFNTICPLYGIVNGNIMHEFLANVIEECNEFTEYAENLNYTHPERIKATWPSRFPTLDSAMPYVRNPKGLAMKVYGSRKDLGNITPEDGWDFRGSGPIQLTGRTNMAAFAAYMFKKYHITHLLKEWAELLRTEDESGIHSACWLFAIAKQLIDEAVHDNFITIVKRINGGLIGYPERVRIYNLCKQYIPLAA